MLISDCLVGVKMLKVCLTLSTANNHSKTLSFYGTVPGSLVTMGYTDNRHKTLPQLPLVSGHGMYDNSLCGVSV